MIVILYYNGMLWAILEAWQKIQYRKKLEKIDLKTWFCVSELYIFAIFLLIIFWHPTLETIVVNKQALIFHFVF